LPEKFVSLITFHIEYIIPRQHGGDDQLDNLALSCPWCNRAKGPNNHPAIVLPPTFVDEIVETAEASGGHTSNVPKDAKLACGLVIKVPLFIKQGEHVRLDTETHKYLGKEAGKR